MHNLFCCGAKGSISFAKEIREFKSYNYRMASFDVKSLFTNFPVNEIIQITLNKLFLNSDSIFQVLTRRYFSKCYSYVLKIIYFYLNLTGRAISGRRYIKKICLKLLKESHTVSAILYISAFTCIILSRSVFFQKFF